MRYAEDREWGRSRGGSVWDLGVSWERREKVKGRGIYKAVTCLARLGLGQFFFLIFESVQVTSTHFSVSNIFHHFSRNFLHFFTFIQNLQNKIKSNKNLKLTIIMSTK